MTKKINPPISDIEQKAQSLIKGALGAIPIIGGIAGESFDIIYKTGFEKRLNQWRISVSEVLNKLLEKQSLDSLAKDDEFHSLLLESTLVALKTHQQIKLDAVKQLLYNSTSSSTEYDFKKLFLNYIDQFTSYHLRTLGMILENQELINSNDRLDSSKLFEKINCEVFHNDEQLMAQVQEELTVGKGLIKKKKIEHQDKVVKYTVLSEIGKRFVDLIRK